MKVLSFEITFAKFRARARVSRLRYVRLGVMAAASRSSGIVYTVILEGGQPWGIRLQGGYEFAQKLRVAKVS